MGLRNAVGTAAPAALILAAWCGATPPAVAGELTDAAPFKGSVIASDPSVIVDGPVLRMSYTDLDWSTNRTVIAVATSADDGRSWQPTGESTFGPVKGVAVAPREGTWLENVEGSALFEDHGRYLLYFSGYRDDGEPQKGFPASLGLATSDDGVAFEVRPDPVLAPTPGWYDNDAVYSPNIVATDEGYFAAYAGHAYTDVGRIERPGVFVLGAHSVDGITWTKLDRPLLPFDEVPAWMRDGAAEPALVKLGDERWVLLFTGLEDEARVIGAADGAAPEGPWRVRPEPIIRPGVPGASDDHQVLAPTALVKDDRLRIWYLGVSAAGALSVDYREAPVDAAAGD